MAWEESVKSVYVICNPEKEVEKHSRLIPHLIIHGIPKTCLKLACPTWGDSLSDQMIFNIYNPFLQRGKLPNFTYKGASLLKSEISLNINFYNIIKHAENDLSGNDSILVFKSDIRLRRDFNENLSKIISDLSGIEWDYVALGNSVNSTKSYYNPIELYKITDIFNQNTFGPMLLNKRFIDKICKTFLPFKDSLDYELKFQMLLHKSTCFSVYPPLAE
jgi:hypothetical protein